MGATATEHPSRDELVEYLFSRSVERVENHVLGGCSECVQEAREALEARHGDLETLVSDQPEEQFGGDGLSEEDRAQLGGEAFAWSTLGNLEEVLAPPRLARLLQVVPCRPRDFVEAIRTERYFQTMGLARLLCKRARESSNDVEEARRSAELAVEVAYQLTAAGYPAPVAMDVLAGACVVAGDAERALRNLPQAERWLIAAEKYFGLGSGRLEGRLEYWRGMGRLRRVQGQCREASVALTRARAVARAMGDARAEGEIVLDLAEAVGDAGEPAKAATLLETATEVFARADEALEHARLRALVQWSVEANEAETAREAFEQLAAGGDRDVGGREWARFAWLSGQVACAVGDVEEAEGWLRAARRELAGAAEWCSYLEVSLHLAEVLVRRGDADNESRFSEEVQSDVRACTAGDVPYGARGRVGMLLLKAETGGASVDELRAMRQYLRRGRGNPYLRFEEAAP